MISFLRLENSIVIGKMNKKLGLFIHINDETHVASQPIVPVHIQHPLRKNLNALPSIKKHPSAKTQTRPSNGIQGSNRQKKKTFCNMWHELLIFFFS